MKTAALVLVSLVVLVSPTVARVEYQGDGADRRAADGERSQKFLLSAQNETVPKTDWKLKDEKGKKPPTGGDDPKPGPVLNNVGPNFGGLTKAIWKFLGYKAQ
jgi:hypothetical protein